MANASQAEDDESSMLDTSVDLHESNELPCSKLRYLLHAVESPTGDVRDQDELIRLLSTSTSSPVHHEVLVCVTELFTRAKQDFSRDTLHVPQDHFMFQSFSTSCSYLYAHAASLNTLPTNCPEIKELCRSFQALFGIQPCVRNQAGAINLNLLVAFWKNATKLCKTFSSFVATPENAPGITKLLMHVEFTVLDTMSFVDRSLLATPLNSTTIAHNIQGARVLFKALQGLLHTFADVVPPQEIGHYWECMGQCLGIVFRHRGIAHVDPACQKHWTCLIDDTASIIAASMPLGRPSTENPLIKAFEKSLFDLVNANSSSIPPERVVHLVAAYSRYCAEVDHVGQVEKVSRYVAAFDAIMKSASAVEDNDFVTAALVEPALRLYFAANQRGSPQLQLRLLHFTLMQDGGHRRLCRLVWSQALHLWNQFDEACGDQTIQLLVDLVACTDETLGMAHRKALGELMVDLFPAMTPAQKTVCIDTCSAVVENICADGPSFEFGLAVDATLCLLEQLSGVGAFLEAMDATFRTAFVDKFLVMSFECCGTAVKIIEQAVEENSSIDEGIWRIVDATLLLLRSIYSSTQLNELPPTDQEEIEGYLTQTMPMLVEVLGHLSNSTTGPCGVHRRIVQSARYMLSAFHHGLKRNQDNHLVLLLDAMLRMSNIPTLRMQVALLLKWLADIQVPRHIEEAGKIWRHFCKLFNSLLSSHDWPVVGTALEALWIVLSESSLPTEAKDISQDLNPQHIASVLRYIDLLQRKGENGGNKRKRTKSQVQLERLEIQCGKVKRFCSMGPRQVDDDSFPYAVVDNVCNLLDVLLRRLDTMDGDKTRSHDAL